MTTWTVAGQVVGEAGPGLWVRVNRVLLPNGEEMPLHEEPVYFLRWELVTTARLYDALPACGGSGDAGAGESERALPRLWPSPNPCSRRQLDITRPPS
jgi:hypothetical protein